MAIFGVYGKSLPFPDQHIGFARRDRQHDKIERRDALHDEDIEWTAGDAVLLAVATTVVNDGEHCPGFRLALAGKMRHRELDAGGYTQRE